MEKYISLAHGAGGEKSAEIIKEIRSILKFTGPWKNTDDDAAVCDRGFNGRKLVMTTDSFIIDPIFFPGGDIGKLSVCGTVNDLAVMGAVPLGLSLSIVVEEGFPLADFKKIISSVGKTARKAGVPVVTGDTKVSPRGKLDKMQITTAGVGLAEKILENGAVKPGDRIIASGKLGDHGALILAMRFNYRTKLKSDCRPLFKEIKSVLRYISAAKDPTRGGLAANIVEMAEKAKVKIILEEESAIAGKEALALSGLLGIDVFSLPSEGRFIAAASGKDAEKAVRALKKFNKQAAIIGRAEKGRGVFVKTKIGSLKPVAMPEGKLIPRIC